MDSIKEMCKKIEERDNIVKDAEKLILKEVGNDHYKLLKIKAEACEAKHDLSYNNLSLTTAIFAVCIAFYSDIDYTGIFIKNLMIVLIALLAIMNILCFLYIHNNKKVRKYNKYILMAIENIEKEKKLE